MRYLTRLTLVAAVAFGCEGRSEPIVLDEQLSLQVERPGLLERTTVSPERARDLALEHTAGGTIVEAELEEEGGLLIYSFDIRLADQSMVEIHVDALTGNVMGDDAQSEADEHTEAEGDDEPGGADDENERQP